MFPPLAVPKVAELYAKSKFADWLRASSGQIVDPHTIFDCQIKRIHEYKRQLLKVLHIITLYNRLCDQPALDSVPADSAMRFSLIWMVLSGQVPVLRKAL